MDLARLLTFLARQLYGLFRERTTNFLKCCTPDELWQARFFRWKARARSIGKTSFPFTSRSATEAAAFFCLRRASCHSFQAKMKRRASTSALSFVETILQEVPRRKKIPVNRKTRLVISQTWYSFEGQSSVYCCLNIPYLYRICKIKQKFKLVCKMYLQWRSFTSLDMTYFVSLPINYNI